MIKKEVRGDQKRADETMRPEKYILVQVQEASQPLSEKDHVTNTSPGRPPFSLSDPMRGEFCVFPAASASPW